VGLRFTSSTLLQVVVSLCLFLPNPLLTVLNRQDKKVPRNSQEAQNYFALHPESSSSSTLPAPKPSDPITSSLDALFGPESNTSSSITSAQPDPSSSTASPAPAPTLKPLSGPPKRKKVGGGGGLGAMAASLGVGSKPAKLNTLEKSKLDWNS